MYYKGRLLSLSSKLSRRVIVECSVTHVRTPKLTLPTLKPIYLNNHYSYSAIK
jgi:hypothetical protein